MKSELLASSILAAAILFAAPAFAQDVVGLEEVVVTAQKRSENVQNISVAVTALNEERIEASYTTDITGLSGIAPNVKIENLGVGPTSSFIIRGIGTADPDASFDPGVGLVIDGVYIQRTLGAVVETGDIGQVEILRGPQGTLFGKNSTGGLISLTSKQPTDAFGGDIAVRLGNYDAVDLYGAVNIPLTDSLRTRISASSTTRDGYFTSTITGRNVGKVDITTVRAVTAWQPTDAFDGTLPWNTATTTATRPTTTTSPVPASASSSAKRRGSAATAAPRRPRTAMPTASRRSNPTSPP